jgi:ligand-binding sensor domain-containing protein
LSGLLVSAEGGLQAETTTSEWFARPWQSDDGLPNNTVAGLAQTADGYLWLGTPSGLARFDGIRFEDFSPTNFVAPPNRGTLAMLLGREGALWLALDRGAVVRLDAARTQTLSEGLPSGNPNGLAEDAVGNLWIAYRLGAVCRIKGARVTTVTEQDGLPKGTMLKNGLTTEGSILASASMGSTNLLTWLSRRMQIQPCDRAIHARRA